MNKQEAMLKLKESSWSYEDNSFRLVHIVDLDKAQEIISQIYVSRKVVVPKYVSEWLEECKVKRFPLRSTMTHIFIPDKVNKWLLETGPDGRTFPNQDIFARAWLYDYEVEEEQLYTVELPDPNRKGNNRIYLCKAYNTGKVYICKGNFNPHKNKNLWLTEEEIKKDFQWAWQFREEVN